jgi:hypothetical protein
VPDTQLDQNVEAQWVSQQDIDLKIDELMKDLGLDSTQKIPSQRIISYEVSELLSELD